LWEIPRTVHFVDATDDELTGAARASTMHLVNAFQPAVGNYQLIVTGLRPGLYALTINGRSSDGTAQPMIQVPGVTGVGSTSAFQIQYSSTPGATSSVVTVATLPGTLADLANSLQLGLIDNAG